MSSIPTPLASPATIVKHQNSLEIQTRFESGFTPADLPQLNPTAKQLRNTRKALTMQAKLTSISRAPALAAAKAVSPTASVKNQFSGKESKTSNDKSASPWKSLEALLASEGKGGIHSQEQQHEKNAETLETIFSKRARKSEKGKRAEVEELSQQTQALALLIKGMQLREKQGSAKETAMQHRHGSYGYWEESWSRVLSDDDSLQIPSAFRSAQYECSTAATSSSSLGNPWAHTWHQPAASMHVHPHPMMAPIPAIHIQPAGTVRPQFPDPAVRPSLSPEAPLPVPGVSEPGPTPEFRPFPTQPGTTLSIEVSPIAPDPAEVPASTPTEVPPSGTPSEVPNITPPSFTPPDSPQPEVDLPTRAPPVPLPNTPPITPPGTPAPSPPPETAPIPPPGRPDPTPPPQTPPVPPPGVPPTPPELPPQGPPGPEFPPTPPEVPPPELPPLYPPFPPEFPPERPPGPDIFPPPGIPPAPQMLLDQQALGAATWMHDKEPAGLPSAQPVLLERRPTRLCFSSPQSRGAMRSKAKLKLFGEGSRPCG